MEGSTVQPVVVSIKSSLGFYPVIRQMGESLKQCKLPPVSHRGKLQTDSLVRILLIWECAILSEFAKMFEIPHTL